MTQRYLNNSSLIQDGTSYRTLIAGNMAPTKRALIVGCNYPGESSFLNCVLFLAVRCMVAVV